MEEVWKWVPDYEGRYQVSILGRVRSFLFSTTGKIMVLDKAANGYVRVHFQFKKTWLLHRLVATVFIPNPFALPAVNHIDGNKGNNAASNLAWVSHSDNMRHSWQNLNTYKNRVAVSPRGESNHNAKLNAKQVIEIRSAYASGAVGQRQLARIYGVTKAAIQAVIHRRTWAHI
jgi:hypothetical protein